MFFSKGYCDCAVMLITHLHMASWLSMSGAVPLLPPVCLNGMEMDNFITEYG
jgi:hypothetical protein